MPGKRGTTAPSGQMERDPLERVIAEGKSIDQIQTLDDKAPNQGSWESKVNEGCNTVYSLTAQNLRAVNGRGGPQAGT